MRPTDTYVTSAAAARILGVSSKTIGHWDLQGKLKGVHVIRTLGGHRRYREADLHTLARTLYVQVGEVR